MANWVCRKAWGNLLTSRTRPTWRSWRSFESRNGINASGRLRRAHGDEQKETWSCCTLLTAGGESFCKSTPPVIQSYWPFPNKYINKRLQSLSMFCRLCGVSPQTIMLSVGHLCRTPTDWRRLLRFDGAKARRSPFCPPAELLPATNITSKHVVIDKKPPKENQFGQVVWKIKFSKNV